jgi:hypothetical protein
MIVTLCDSYDSNELILLSRDEHFSESVEGLVRRFPEKVTDIRKNRINFKAKDVYLVLSTLAYYVNNFIGEEFIIEVE